MKISLVALTSLLFFEIHRNGLLRAKGIVILYTGHHIMSHPTNININKYQIWKNCVKYLHVNEENFIIIIIIIIKFAFLQKL